MKRVTFYKFTIKVQFSLYMLLPSIENFRVYCDKRRQLLIKLSLRIYDIYTNINNNNHVLSMACSQEALVNKIDLKR